MTEKIGYKPLTNRNQPVYCITYRTLALFDSTMAETINMDLNEYKNILKKYGSRFDHQGESVFDNEEDIQHAVTIFRLLGY